MTKFEKVSYYYKTGLWTAERVKNAVKKGWITDKEAQKILEPSLLTGGKL